MKLARITFLLFAVSFLALVRGYCEKPVHLSAADRGTVPSTFFNLNILGISEGTGWPSMPFAAWRDFHFSWPRVEPARDQWDFSGSDHDVHEAQRHGVDIVAVLVGVPNWATSSDEPGNPRQPGKPSSLSDWSNYVRTVALRYKGQIHYYELWNEPIGAAIFQRDPSLLMTLNRVAYETLKSVDPTIVVLSSAFASGDPNPDRAFRQLGTFVDAGLLKNCDVISYHFYVIPVAGSTAPRSPEELLPYITAVKAKMKKAGVQKPLWDTETGWAVLNHDQNPQPPASYWGDSVDPELGAAYLARTYILGWAAGLDRIFWYAWRHGYMGMTEFNGDPKAPAIAYATVQRWLVGAQLNSCDRNKDGNWLCQLKLADGTSGVISWTEANSAQLDVDPAWQAHSYWTIDGRKHDLGDQTSMQISRSPILLLSSR